jgi:hypothetical protein
MGCRSERRLLGSPAVGSSNTGLGQPAARWWRARHELHKTLVSHLRARSQTGWCDDIYGAFQLWDNCKDDSSIRRHY